MVCYTLINVLKGTFENFFESPSELHDFQRYRNRLLDSFFFPRRWIYEPGGLTQVEYFVRRNACYLSSLVLRFL